MSESFGSRLKKAWNAFTAKNTQEAITMNPGPGTYTRPDRVRFSGGNDRTIITSVLNRIAIDSAQITIRHVRLDENGRYVQTIDSSLNNCLTVEANKDQSYRAFFQDVYQSMFDEGCVAVVPIDTKRDSMTNKIVEINSIRVGEITSWFPDHIKVKVYNDRTGNKQELIFPKSECLILENPFYAVMNEKSSTLKRLVRKLTLLDAIDEQSGSGKLDLIIQLPYAIKTDARRQQALQRKQDLEDQLANSKFGIAYTDGTEHVTQLNRSVENNLMKQIEYLTTEMFSQLGITQEIMNGSATEEAMLNYTNRTIEVVVATFVNEMRRKWLTQTARTQGQEVMYFIDPFRLVTVKNIADVADRFTRNEILTSNEVRQIIGMKPSDDPEADTLRNKNLNPSDAQMAQEGAEEPQEEQTEENSTTPEDRIAYGRRVVEALIQNG